MNWVYNTEFRCHILTGHECEIWLTPRPSYCDRGNWLAYLEARGGLAREIDAADGWPRYYFDFERAKAECEDWLVKRGQMLTRTGPAGLDRLGEGKES